MKAKRKNTMKADKCAHCNWLEKDHQYGFCYHYSDESEDYFYDDRKFLSKKSLEGKRISVAFNGKITVDPEGVWVFKKEIRPYTPLPPKP